MRTTFEYKASKSYAELTNSIRELIQNLDSAEKTPGRSNTHVANLLSELAQLSQLAVKTINFSRLLPRVA